MTNQKTILLTGCTGYLGAHLGYALLQQGARVIALVRPKADASPTDRARRAIERIHEGMGAVEPISFDNLTIITGDVRQQPKELIAAVRNRVSTLIDEVWHCAALLKFKERDRAEIEETNILGTENMLALVQGINSDSTPRYFHISTAYSSGRTQAAVPETICTKVGAFRSLYDWSKHHGEQVVAAQQQQSTLDATIFRPSIIISAKNSGVIGDTGYYQVVRGYYQLQQYLRSATRQQVSSSATRVRVLGDPAVAVNLVPVDFVINAMLAIADQPALQTDALKVFNLVNEQPPQLGMVHETVCDNLNIRGFELVSADAFAQQPMNRLEENLARRISFQSPYMNEATNFVMQKFRAMVPVDKVPIAAVDQSYLAALNHAFYKSLSALNLQQASP